MQVHGDDGDGGGEASGGSVATTSEGDASSGSVATTGGGGQRPAKRQRGERRGRAGSIRRERAAKGR